MRLAVIVPCLNEESTVCDTVLGIKKSLESVDVEYQIYVYDNLSTDKTVERALECGGIVRVEKYRGKANVIRRAFRDIDADYYLIIDGDSTYSPDLIPKMLDIAIKNQAHMVNYVRQSNGKAYRKGHIIGNFLINKTVEFIFGREFKDMLSGCKLMSRDFVKSFPVLSEGFDIETEIAIHCLECKLNIEYVYGPYFPRPVGSYSKLKTFSDGFKILKLIVNMFRHEKPVLFYSCISLIFAFLSLLAGIPTVVEFFQTGKVLKFPRAILASALGVISVIMFSIGLILDTVTRGRKEIKMLFILNAKNKTWRI